MSLMIVFMGKPAFLFFFFFFVFGLKEVSSFTAKVVSGSVL